MKITRKQLRRLIMESANFGEPGQLGYGRTPSLLMIMDDYIETEDKAAFDQRVLDAMKKYVKMYNDDIPAEAKFKHYLLIPNEVMSATMTALSSFDPQTGGAVKDNYRFSKSSGSSYPIDDRGNIKSPSLTDDMSIRVYERALVEDNVNNFVSILSKELDSNLSVHAQGGNYYFAIHALGLPSSQPQGSLYR